MKKTIFAVSDIHGHFKELKKALDESGYDENNPEHLLISLGDAFDRGTEALNVYKYLRKLSDENKAIILRGNHTGMFIEYLNGASISPFNYLKNGTNETLADFLHRTRPFESWCFVDKNIDEPTYMDFANWINEAREEINNEYPDLLDWLENRPYYYETKNYIFTHGCINGTCNDWHEPDKDLYGKILDWDACLWARPEDFYNPITNTEKHVVVGHIHTDLLKNIAGKEFDGNQIYTRDDGRITGIDTCTIMTKRINVLVIKEEELDCI